MITLENNYDEIEKIIYEEGLRIIAVHIHADLDMMLIVLNNKRTLQRSLSYTDRLKNASTDELTNYQLIAKGVGIHWPDIDEDLSLKGFLQEEMTQSLFSFVGNVTTKS